jgi:hypothetical protein
MFFLYKDHSGLERTFSETVATASPVVLAQGWTELEYSSDICRAVSGVHTELYQIILSTFEVPLWKETRFILTVHVNSGA